MTDTCPTVKVKSTHPESQGLFVEINASDFDPEKHELLDGEPVAAESESAPKPRNKPGPKPKAADPAA